MKKAWTTLCALALVLVCIFVLPAEADAETYSGQCGSNLTWTLDSQTGVLSISGTGDMYDYGRNYPDTAPWNMHHYLIQTVNIGEGVTSIGACAFYDYNKLKNVTIPDSVTSIGSFAFSSCGSLNGVTMGNGTTSIGVSAFSACGSLASITIPDSVTSIGASAFNSCSSLASITIPDSVTSIGGFAFANCDGLASVTLGSSITGIGEYAFNSCGNLSDVYVTDIQAWFGISFVVKPANPMFYADNLHILDAQGNEVTELVLDDSITEIPDKAFQKCVNLTSITIPDSVTRIGADAFASCGNLASVTMGNGVTSIGKNAFYECGSLASVSMSNSVTSIGEYAFYKCSLLAGITIPDDVTRIGVYAFTYCDGLTSITIPDSVTSIGANAFAFCDSLASVTMGSGVTSIGKSAFDCWRSLKDVYVADLKAWWGISFANDFANPMFYADNLHILDTQGNEVSELVLDHSITYIPDNAFQKCTNLTSITIPDSVTTIGNYAFRECGSLVSVNMGNGVTSIGAYAFKYCNSLASVVMGSGITNIGISAFDGCSSLTGIAIPDSVTSIGEYAFHDCKGLARVIVGSGITDIGKYAFASCNNIKYVYFNGTREEWEKVTAGAGNDILSNIQFGIPQECTVVFRNWDGTVLSSSTYFVGEQMNAPSVPERANTKVYTYTFTGWDKPVETCIGDAIYTAIFDQKYVDYTVCFQNWDGKVVSKKVYHYGDKITVPKNPTRVASKNYSYAFAGWDKKVSVTCTTNVTYTATYTAKLIAPTGVKVTNNATTGKPVVRWNKAGGAAKYEIYRSANGGAYKLLTTTAQTTYTDTSAKAGTTYRYRISAVSANKNILKSDQTAAQKLTCKLATPVLTATHKQAARQNVIQWKKVTGATSYVVQVSVNGGSYKTLITTNKLTYTHKNVVGGSTYRYRVLAKSAVAQSAYSAIKTVKAKCAAPATVKVALNARKPLITWSAVSGAQKYQVYVANSKTGAFKLLKTVTGKSLKHTAAAAGKTYYYKIRAVDSTGAVGAYSVVKGITSR